MLPPLSAIGSAVVQLWGPPAALAAEWDNDQWDNAQWQGAGQWHDVTRVSMNVQITWGVDDNAGALSISAAGSWSVITYDPDRLLDPSNANAPYVNYLKPGGMIRLVYRRAGKPDEQVRVGFIDEIEYDMATKQGAIRGADAVSVLVKAKVPEGLEHDQTAPTTLRARAKWILAKAGVSYVTVENTPAGQYDPLVGAPLDVPSSAWQQIATAAFDCLWAVWVDRKGVLRFRDYGEHPSSGVKFGAVIGGMEFESVTTKLSMENVYNHLRAKRDFLQYDDVYSNAQSDQSIEAYGDLLLQRERRNPNSYLWVNQLRIDRAAETVQYEMATIRPQTEQHLMDLLDLGMAESVWIYVDSDPPINRSPYVLGGRFEANTESGWSAGLVTYLPPSQWYDLPVKQQQRVTTNLGVEIYTNFEGQDFGDATKAQQEIRATPMLVTGDETHQVLMGFREIDWTNVESIENALLRFYRPYHEDASGQNREEGWIKVERVTEPWNENTIWPGPATTTTGDVFRYVESQIPEWCEIEITDIVRAWAPVTVEGGGRLDNYGIKLSSSWPELQEGQTPEHVLLSTKLSSMPAYISLTVVMLP